MNYFTSMTILAQDQVKIIQKEAYLQSFWTEMRLYSPQKRHTWFMAVGFPGSSGTSTEIWKYKWDIYTLYELADVIRGQRCSGHLFFSVCTWRWRRSWFCWTTTCVLSTFIFSIWKCFYFCYHFGRGSMLQTHGSHRSLTQSHLKSETGQRRKK